MNLTQCVTKVADILNRSDVNSQIVDAVNTAIRKVERKHNFNYMLTRTGFIDCDSGVDGYAYPDRFKSFSLMKVTTRNVAEVLGFIEVASQARVNAAYPDNSSSTGEPTCAYLRPELSDFVVRPIPDQNYSFIATYWAFSAPLVLTTNESHWLLTNFEEVLVYGALLEMVAIIKDFEREPLWRGRFKEVLRDLKNEEVSSASTLENPFVTGAYSA